MNMQRQNTTTVIEHRDQHRRRSSVTLSSTLSIDRQSSSSVTIPIDIPDTTPSQSQPAQPAQSIQRRISHGSYATVQSNVNSEYESRNPRSNGIDSDLEFVRNGTTLSTSRLSNSSLNLNSSTSTSSLFRYSQNSISSVLDSENVPPDPNVPGLPVSRILGTSSLQERNEKPLKPSQTYSPLYKAGRTSESQEFLKSNINDLGLRKDGNRGRRERTASSNESEITEESPSSSILGGPLREWNSSETILFGEDAPSVSIKGKEKYSAKEPLKTVKYENALEQDAVLSSATPGLQSAKSTVVMLAVREITRNRCFYCLGCTSIFLVVFLAALLITAFSITPIILLSIAESNAGSLDLVIRSNNPSSPRLNFSMIEKKFESNPTMNQIAPRYANLPISIYRAKGCQGWNESQPLNNTFTYAGPPDLPTDDIQTFASKRRQRDACLRNGRSCMNTQCPDSSATSSVYLIDSERESNIGIGRSWPHPPVPKGSVYIHEKLAFELDLKAGDWIILSLPMWQFRQTYDTVVNETVRILAQNNASVQMQNSWDVYIPLRIDLVFSNSAGKFNKNQISVIALEYSHVLELIAEYYNPFVYPPVFKSVLEKASQNNLLYQEAQQIIFSCPHPRHTCYQSQDFDSVSRQITRWASDIVFEVGLNTVNQDLPVLNELQYTEYLSALLDLGVSLVLVLMSCLSIFLIYGLLNISIETRAFEMGILRMIGAKRIDVCLYILVQALTYAIPAWVFGLVFAQGGFYFASPYLSDFLDIALQPILTLPAYIVATIIGLLIPLGASIFPMRRALSRTLQNSLNSRRHSVNATEITFERNHPGKVDNTQLLIGITLSIFGFIIYYFLPLTLVNNNVSLLFQIFLFLLLCMLFGLVVLSMNIEPIMERLLLTVFQVLLFFENQSVWKLTLKNLLAHRRRNRQIEILYALSMAFLVFLAVMIQMQIGSLEIGRRKDFGTSLVLRIDRRDQNNRPLGMLQLETLERFFDSSPFIEAHATISYPLNSITSEYTPTTISNFGRISSYEHRIFAVSPTFFEIMNEGNTFDIDSVKESLFDTYGENLGSLLYSPYGIGSVILGSYYKKELSITSPNELQDDQPEIIAAVSSPSSKRFYSLQPLALLKSSPVLRLSQYPPRGIHDAIVSFTDFVRLSNSTLSSIDEVPIQTLLIRIQSNTPQDQYNILVRDLKRIVRDRGVDLLELKSSLETVETAESLLNNVFGFSMVIPALIGMFGLTSSLYINISEQKKEIGVLRSLGVSKSFLMRMYLYESCVLLMSAALCGIIVGITVGYALSLQTNLLIQVDVPFNLPWFLISLSLLTSIVTGLLSTIMPVWRLTLKPSIVKLLKS
ncbi:FtsX-like permease family-domain-containing protein [Paraphysoderma sedebokerense]|nr:FtsX-like permease family-domain-containing protein [Paraphysoderma sedebokerense]